MLAKGNPLSQPFLHLPPNSVSLISLVAHPRRLNSLPVLTCTQLPTY